LTELLKNKVDVFFWYTVYKACSNLAVCCAFVFTTESSRVAFLPGPEL